MIALPMPYDLPLRSISSPLPGELNRPSKLAHTDSKSFIRAASVIVTGQADTNKHIFVERRPNLYYTAADSLHCH